MCFHFPIFTSLFITAAYSPLNKHEAGCYCLAHRGMALVKGLAIFVAGKQDEMPHRIKQLLEIQF